MTTVLYEDTTACKYGHEDARRWIMRTSITGNVPIRIIECDECDRAHCFTCKRVLTRGATFCTCGGMTWPPKRTEPAL